MDPNPLVILWKGGLFQSNRQDGDFSELVTEIFGS